MRQYQTFTLTPTATTTPRAAVLSLLMLAAGCADVESNDNNRSDTGAAWRGDVPELGEWTDAGFARSTEIPLSCPSGVTPVTYDGKVDFQLEFPQDNAWLGRGSCRFFNESPEAADTLARARLAALSECRDDAPTFTCDEGCAPFTYPGKCTVSTERVSVVAEIEPDEDWNWSCVLRFEVIAKATDQGACLRPSEPPTPVDGSGQLADG